LFATLLIATLLISMPPSFGQVSLHGQASIYGGASLNVSCASSKTKYTTPTTTGTFTVPPGCTTIHVKAWGAGGGDDSAADGSGGGGGGYAGATVTVTSGETLTFYVGGGGRWV
jgi:hypothetical protein